MADDGRDDSWHFSDGGHTEPWRAMADRPEIEEANERWIEAFERAWGHVPLSLYDEDRKPAIYAFQEMAAKIESLHRECARLADLLGKQSESYRELGEAQAGIEARDRLIVHLKEKGDLTHAVKYGCDVSGASDRATASSERLDATEGGPRADASTPPQRALSAPDTTFWISHPVLAAAEIERLRQELGSEDDAESWVALRRRALEAERQLGEWQQRLAPLPEQSEEEA